MRVSIVVPVFGVEQFIEDCAVSLFEQTYENIEYIFVDDCTPDNSIGVLEAVASRYPTRSAQLRIIHNPRNLGSGATRAVGLAATTGQFIMYVDSDDVLEPQAVDLLCARQAETQADIVDGAFCRLSGSVTSDLYLPYHGSREVMFKLLIAKNTISHNVWGRLIRKGLHTDNSISFTPGVDMAEDYCIMSQLLFFGTRAYIDNVVYKYRINDSGTFASGLSKKNINSFLRANRIVGEFLQRNDLSHDYRFAYELGMLQTYHSALTVGMTRKEIDALMAYQPSLALFCLVHNLLCRRSTLFMLRVAYLIIKWFYKRAV